MTLPSVDGMSLIGTKIFTGKDENKERQGKSTDWWDEISDTERTAIEESIAEADRGELIPHEEVIKED